MKILTALILLAFSLALLPVRTLAANAEGRPRLEDYPSYYAFLEAMQAWNNAATADRTAPIQASAANTAANSPQATTADIDPTSELAPPPFEITGPESLDSAIEKARTISHPDYKEKIRYRRTTHLSFPLHSIDGNDMSAASVTDTLNLKGKSEAERKAALESMTLQMDLEQRKLQDSPVKEEMSLPGSSPVIQGALASGGTSRVDITVSGH